jgi:hypothetical protein
MAGFGISCVVESSCFANADCIKLAVEHRSILQTVLHVRSTVVNEEL